MDDPLDMRDELETESLTDLEARPSANPEELIRASDDDDYHSFSLFANREEEPEMDDAAESPVDLLMKSGQPRLALVHGEDEVDDDVDVIDLAPADPAPDATDAISDTWPWLADSLGIADEAPLLKSLDAQFNSDLIAPTACGAMPTSLEVNRRPMPSLPKPGEIASVAQRVGAQFAGEAKTHRTPNVPALLTTMPKTFTPAAPVKISGDRPTAASAAAYTPAVAPSPIAPVASMAISPPTQSAPSIIASMTAASAISGPSAPVAPRKTPDTPKRIGDGKLVQSRLTWKPGDPFAENARSAGMPGRFRWELMLSTACGTAVFGLAFFWIMRLVF